MSRGKLKSTMQTRCYRHIEENGPQNTVQLLQMLKGSRRANATPNELSQMLSSSPLFERIGFEMVADIGWSSRTSGYKVAVWATRPLDMVARKWLSKKHHVRQRSSLPRVLLDEIERLEEEGCEKV